MIWNWQKGGWPQFTYDKEPLAEFEAQLLRPEFHRAHLSIWKRATKSSSRLISSATRRSKHQKLKGSFLTVIPSNPPFAGILDSIRIIGRFLHIRSTNPIESTFATVKLWTRVTKGAGSRTVG